MVNATAATTEPSADLRTTAAATPTVDATAASSAAGAAKATAPTTTSDATTATTTASRAHLDAAELAEANANATRVISGARFLRRTAGGPTTMTITLEPAHLGQVRLDLTLENGALSVRLTAEHGVGADALQKALPKLQSELEADGLRLSDLGVGVGPHGGQAEASNDARRHATGLDSDTNGTRHIGGRRGRILDRVITTVRRTPTNSRFDLDL